MHFILYVIFSVCVCVCAYTCIDLQYNYSAVDYKYQPDTSNVLARK